MKILLIGFLVFSAWSSLSTYIYVCRIKGLCNEPATSTIEAVYNNNPFDDTLNKSAAFEQSSAPDNHVVYFAFDKSDFNSDAVTDKYVNESKIYLTQNAQARINITGHTDSIGTIEYNLALGYRRAQSLQQYFESKGLPANKILIESKGENKPVGINTTEAGRANNRRAEITLKKQ